MRERGRGGVIERVRVSPAGRCLGIERSYGHEEVAASVAGPVGKRLFDIAFALVALTVTGPMLLLIAAAIRLEDGGPVLFAHRRQTRGGRSFACLKFRTMRRDAACWRRRLAARDRSDGPQFFVPDDPRVLRIGRWLRRWNLDELPQFVNVLQGHMSVVGPRPSPAEENRFCPAWREARLSVRPGLTGLWQLRRTRRPGVDFQEWIRFDLEYVRRQSWGLDLRLIAGTPLAVLAGGLRGIGGGREFGESPE